MYIKKIGVIVNSLPVNNWFWYNYFCSATTGSLVNATTFEAVL